MIRNYTLIFLLIVGGTHFLWANSKESLGSPSEAVEPLKRLPGLEFGTVRSVEDLDMNSPTVRAGYQFKELDRQLALSMLNAPSEAGLVEGDDLADILVDIGTGDYGAKVKRARNAIQKAIDLGNFISQFTGEDIVSFPLVLQQTIGNVTFNVTFNKMTLLPTHAELEVFLSIEIPEEDITLYFGSPNIKFTKEGGIIGDALLGLYNDVAIPIGGNKSALVLRKYQQQGEGENAQNFGTYAIIDCDGFRELAVESEIIFSRDWIVPVNDQGEVLSSGRVMGHIQTVLTDWNDFLVDDLSLPNFALAAFPDMAFNITNAVFDFSDYRNGANVNFPDEYADQNLLPGNPNLWRGVYIQNLELILPKQFAMQDCQSTTSNPENGGTGSLFLDDQSGLYAALDSDFGEVHGPNPGGDPFVPTADIMVENGCRFSIGVNDLLIDPNGVSGNFYAENVFELDAGKMDQWRFSVDKLEVEIVTSELTGFGFEGEIGVPIAKKSKPFGYDAFFDTGTGDYSFSVISREDLEFPLWKAGEIFIAPGSSITVTSTDDSFVPMAVLNGHMGIGKKFVQEEEESEEDEFGFEIARLSFEKLTLQTVAPYLSIATDGKFEYEQGMKLVEFPIAIAEPSLEGQTDGSTVLAFNVELNLMSEGDGGFAGATRVELVGRLDQGESMHLWKYDELNVSAVAVDIVLPKISISGTVNIFREDPDYGNGFYGAMSADVMDGNFVMDVETYFGSKDDYRYWYFDVLVQSENLSIPILPPALNINGFGGGAYHHMEMDRFGGSGQTGIIYKPTPEVGLGLKASVALTNESQTYDGLATLEIVFDNNLALQEIVFYGKMDFIRPEDGQGAPDPGERISSLTSSREEAQAADDQQAQSQPDQISAALFLRMNFEEGFELQGTFLAYLSLGEGALTGQGAIDLLISEPQNRWHLYVGGYNDGSVTIQQLNSTVSLYPVQVSIFFENSPDTPDDDMELTAQAYFMTGNDLPGPPPLDPAAAAFFGVGHNNRGDLGENAAAGTGFAFGASAHFDIRYEKADCKWVEAEGGVGFDISHLKYPAGSACAANGQSPHGVNYWRSTGNLWAFLDIKGGRWKVLIPCLPIPKIGFGILLQADVPRPSYFHGQAVLNLLGININLSVDIGQECNVIN